MIFEKIYKSEIEVLNLIENSLETNTSLTLTYFNQHCFNIYNSVQKYKKVIDDNFEVFSDGIGIYFTLKLFGYKKIQRFNATDLNEKLFNHFSMHSTRLFLIGGRFDEEFVLNIASQKKINIVGYQNGFFSDSNLQVIVKKINSASPEAIVIGMGVPKQELFAAKLDEFYDNKLIICVGNFLEYYFKTKTRAPKIFRIICLEWLFRLFLESRRLWKRYLIGIPVFFYNIFKMKFFLIK